jgi:hypothetical protein
LVDRHNLAVLLFELQVFFYALHALDQIFFADDRVAPVETPGNVTARKVSKPILTQRLAISLRSRLSRVQIALRLSISTGAA